MSVCTSSAIAAKAGGPRRSCSFSARSLIRSSAAASSRFGISSSGTRFSPSLTSTARNGATSTPLSRATWAASRSSSSLSGCCAWRSSCPTLFSSSPMVTGAVISRPAATLPWLALTLGAEAPFSFLLAKKVKTAQAPAAKVAIPAPIEPRTAKLAGSFRNCQMQSSMARPLRAQDAIIVVIYQKCAVALP
jgi:hypothetical protein